MKSICLSLFISLLLFSSCSEKNEDPEIKRLEIANVLNFEHEISDPYQRELAFSDQGAWFAFGFPKDQIGFSGPFLMTQENGVWLSPSISELILMDNVSNKKIQFEDSEIINESYLSRLERKYSNDSISIDQTLFFANSNTAQIRTRIINKTNLKLDLGAYWWGSTFDIGFKLNESNHALKISSNKSDALIEIGTNKLAVVKMLNDTSYMMDVENLVIKANEFVDLYLNITVTFPDKQMPSVATEYDKTLSSRIKEKNDQLSTLNSKLDSNWQGIEQQVLLNKSVLTLQTNWRSPAGELKHSGLFPSYHFVWFHGFWAWDSWKHAVALANYDPDLAKEQIKAMFDFENENGFIADCVYRDTSIEAHNYRNTKPPLSAWAVWKTFKSDKDTSFLQELYPKIKLQHRWWYKERDHDKDGLCEYGSTDGSLIAAKWESGMDNAVRFDKSEILMNSPSAYSLNQESVDLNAYLYAEKGYLSKMADVLAYTNESEDFKKEAQILKTQIQDQFFDEETGWFYDTSIDGEDFIKVMGCEGWIPLWANVANEEQAKRVRDKMMDSKLFFTKLPFQTLSADHPKFKPEGGYWRGPNWLDQSYFGIKGLHNYGFHRDAYDATYLLINNAEGILTEGEAIRENYNPITGKGLSSYNFSWSAAHYLLLLLNDE